MPRSKGKQNYKVDLLIQVVEEKLPNGAHGWQEVAFLYQQQSGELVLRDYEDVKRHWVDKCCNKFKKPMGNPGDPKRDMILRCQWIQERILKKSNAAVMGVESGGDDGFDLDEDSNLDDEDEEDEVEEEIGVAESLADGFRSRTQSRVPTPTNYGDFDGGIGIVAPEELPIRPVLTLQSATQPQFRNIFLSPDATTRFNQQLYVNRARTAAGHRNAAEVSAAAPDHQQPAEQPPIAVQPIVTGQQPVTQQVPAQPSTQQSAKKKVKRSSESSISKKTKSSQSERRGSIVKSIDKLASSIATDEANSAAAASSSSMMPMFLALQMQQQAQQQAQQQQLQQQLQFQQSLLQRDGVDKAHLSRSSSSSSSTSLSLS